MSIHKRWRFTEAMVKDAPDCAGVYVLWCDRQPLAVGEAGGHGDTVQSRLLSHLEHSLENITHYSWELTRAPKARAAQVERELGLAVAAPRLPDAGRPAAAHRPGKESEGVQET